MKNPHKKMVTRENAHEVWQTPNGQWTWYVLKKWQNDDNKPYARWFCDVTSPIVGEKGEMGDCYVDEIKKHAKQIK
jgi:hypothetical protein